MFRKIKIMGLDIAANSKNAEKLAHDLIQCQANLFRQTNLRDFLFTDAGAGFINFELNKFGCAIEAAIKKDLREVSPASLKKYLDFYVNVLKVCCQSKDYEIAVRVLNGINNAMLKDMPENYSLTETTLPEEDKQTESVRKTIRAKLSEMELWQQLANAEYPPPPKCKKIFQEHMANQEKFLPSIQALINFITIRLDNLKSCRLDSSLPLEIKSARLEEMKTEIHDELAFIERILEGYLPESDDLNFKELREKFAEQLQLKLNSHPETEEELLDELVKTGRVLVKSNSQHDLSYKPKIGLRMKFLTGESPAGDAQVIDVQLSPKGVISKKKI
jgi:hypothetical protein